MLLRDDEHAVPIADHDIAGLDLAPFVEDDLAAEIGHPAATALILGV